MPRHSGERLFEPPNQNAAAAIARMRQDLQPDSEPAPPPAAAPADPLDRPALGAYMGRPPAHTGDSFASNDQPDNPSDHNLDHNHESDATITPRGVDAQEPI